MKAAKRKPRSTTPKSSGAVQIIPRKALASEVQKRIEETGLNQTITAAIVQDAPSQISLLMGGHLDGFSPDRLLRMLTRLGADIDIVIKHTHTLSHRGHVRVVSKNESGPGRPRSRKAT